MSKKLPKLIGSSIVLVTLALGVSLLLLFIQPFNVVKSFLDVLSSNGTSSFTETYLHANRIHFILVSFGILIVGICGLFIQRRLILFIHILIEDCKWKISSFQNKLIWFFKKESRLHSTSVLVVLLVGVINRILYLPYPFRYDEAFTYYSFVKTPFVFLIANYSYPNNHIFHSVLVQLSTLVFGDSLVAIRLPAFIAGLAILPCNYLVVRRLFNKNIALISTGILACSFQLIDYSVNARGYTMICLFFIILLYFAQKQHRSYADAFWIILISSIGFYTIPVFLYPFVIFLFWIYLKEGKLAIKELAIYSVGTLLIAFIFYTPVLLYTGLSSIIDNRYILKYDYVELPEQIFSRFISVFRWSLYGFGTASLYVGAFGLVLSMITNNKRANLLLLSSIVCICVLLLMHRAIPPNRVWIFILPVLIAFMINGLFSWVKRETVLEILGLIIVLFLSVIINLNRFSLSLDRSIFEYDEIASQLKNTISPGDKLVAKIPIDYPFEYYLTKHEVPASFSHVNNGGYPGNYSIPKDVYVMVDKRYDQTPQKVYKQSGSTFELWKEYTYIEVYKLIN